MTKDSTSKKNQIYRKSPLERNGVKEGFYDDPVSGKVELLFDPHTNQRYAGKKRTFNYYEHFKREAALVQKRIEANHPNLNNLTDYSAKKKTQFCSQNQILKIYSKIPETTLYKEMQQRAPQGKYFHPQELRELLSDVARGANHREKFFGSHGNISPASIGQAVEGQWQLLDDLNNLLPNPSQSQKANIMTQENIHASPELYQMQKLAKSKNSGSGFGVSLDEADAFSLGLTMVEAGNLRSCQDIYPLGKQQIDDQKLRRHFDEFYQKYNKEDPQLVEAVEMLLHPDPNKRATFSDIENAIYTGSRVYSSQMGMPGNYSARNHNAFADSSGFQTGGQVRSSRRHMQEPYNYSAMDNHGYGYGNSYGRSERYQPKLQGYSHTYNHDSSSSPNRPISKLGILII